MAHNDNIEDRYASPHYLANYLAVEWGDILFPPGHPLTGEAPTQDALDEDRVGRDRIAQLEALYRPGAFYCDLADQVAQWCRRLSVQPQRVCDIGGSTGRLIYELNHRILTKLRVQPTELLLVEQSAAFCQWAHRLIGAHADGDWGRLRGELKGHWVVPLPHLPEQPHFEMIEAESVRRKIDPLDNLAICCALGEQTPRAAGHFDLVVCANVVDRHADPKAFVRRIARLVRPNGLLVLASPFDFNRTFTPNAANWVHSLTDLLPVGWKASGLGEIPYVHRMSLWHWLTYKCQVLAAVAPAETPRMVLPPQLAMRAA
jgi:SAM-dependent methyltransferase